MMCKNKWCVKNNGFKVVIEIDFYVCETVFYISFYIKFKAFLSDTKHIILLKTGEKASLIFPISVILDYQYVVLHKTWVLTIPNMIVLQFILGSSYIGRFSAGLL